MTGFVVKRKRNKNSTGVGFSFYWFTDLSFPAFLKGMQDRKISPIIF